MKTLGNLILMTAICIAVFMVFTAGCLCNSKLDARALRKQKG
jgi:hypothetical protein